MLKRSEKRYPLVRHLCKKKRSRSRTKIIVYIKKHRENPKSKSCKTIQTTAQLAIGPSAQWIRPMRLDHFLRLLTPLSETLRSSILVLCVCVWIFRKLVLEWKRHLNFVNSNVNVERSGKELKENLRSLKFLNLEDSFDLVVKGSSKSPEKLEEGKETENAQKRSKTEFHSKIGLGEWTRWS